MEIYLRDGPPETDRNSKFISISRYSLGVINLRKFFWFIWVCSPSKIILIYYKTPTAPFRLRSLPPRLFSAHDLHCFSSLNKISAGVIRKSRLPPKKFSLHSSKFESHWQDISPHPKMLTLYYWTHIQNIFFDTQNPLNIEVNPYPIHWGNLTRWVF